MNEVCYFQLLLQRSPLRNFGCWVGIQIIKTSRCNGKTKKCSFVNKFQQKRYWYKSQGFGVILVTALLLRTLNYIFSCFPMLYYFMFLKPRKTLKVICVCNFFQSVIAHRYPYPSIKMCTMNPIGWAFRWTPLECFWTLKKCYIPKTASFQYFVKLFLRFFLVPTYEIFENIQNKHLLYCTWLLE